MELNKILKECQDNDILCSQEKLCKVSNLKEEIDFAFKEILSSHINAHLENKFNLSFHYRREVKMENQLKTVYAKDILFEEGLPSSLLKAGSSGWQNGRLKVRVSLEFIPDEEEKELSPLDSVRQEIKTH